jgi:hypothetical protein
VQLTNAVAGVRDGGRSEFCPRCFHVLHGEQLLGQVHECKGFASLRAVTVVRGVLSPLSLFDRKDCPLSPASTTGVAYISSVKTNWKVW